MATELALTVQFAVDAPELPTPADFRRWAAAALTTGQAENDAERAPFGRAELTIRVVDAAESASLNQAYRQKPGPTNVLAFPLTVPTGIDELADTLFGDVVICAPVVAAEATRQSKLLAAHWAHLVIHGVLHLLGYDHQGAAEADAMERQETVILAGLDFPDPYQRGHTPSQPNR